ncbi:multicopper oxidase domain-containing protein, partial [Escherichia coli]|nr:multicopper oxidase domain-containing protein [Escherichia coli]
DNKETEFWAYNGQLPGPQIEVFEGDTVEIEFINHLPQPSTVHWHGLDVPNEADGNPMDMVEPQGKKVYRFTLPQGSAGTYWYHPHPHDHVSEQVYKGLAGTFVVKAKNDPLAHLPEQHWVISDLRLNADGTIPANTMLD